jgi:hypothetical protein
VELRSHFAGVPKPPRIPSPTADLSLCMFHDGSRQHRPTALLTSMQRQLPSATKATPQAVTPCAGAKCPAFAVQILTEEGPVIVQQWADNTVLVSESFDQMTAGKLVDAVREGNADEQADKVQRDELGSRLYDLPEFSAFRALIGDRILRELESAAK